MSSKSAWAIPGQSGLRSETLSQKKPQPKQTKTQPTVVFIDQVPKLRTQEVIEDTLQPGTLSSLGPTPCVSALLSSSLFPMCLLPVYHLQSVFPGYSHLKFLFALSAALAPLSRHPCPLGYSFPAAGPHSTATSPSLPASLAAASAESGCGLR